MAHSVIEEMGELIDITPVDRNTPREALLFLRHLGSEAEFEPMKTDCAVYVHPPFTSEDLCQSEILAETGEESEIAP